VYLMFLATVYLFDHSCSRLLSLVLCRTPFDFIQFDSELGPDWWIYAVPFRAFPFSGVAVAVAVDPPLYYCSIFRHAFFSFRSIDLQFPFLSIRIHHHFSSLLFLPFSHTPCLSILFLIPALNTTRLVSEISEYETWGLRCGSLCAIYGGVVGVTTARKRCGREVRQKTRVLDRCPQHNTSPSWMTTCSRLWTTDEFSLKDCLSVLMVAMIQWWSVCRMEALFSSFDSSWYQEPKNIVIEGRRRSIHFERGRCTLTKIFTEKSWCTWNLNTQERKEENISNSNSCNTNNSIICSLTRTGHHGNHCRTNVSTDCNWDDTRRRETRRLVGWVGMRGRRDITRTTILCIVKIWIRNNDIVRKWVDPTFNSIIQIILPTHTYTDTYPSTRERRRRNLWALHIIHNSRRIINMKDKWCRHEGTTNPYLWFNSIW